MGLFGAGDPPCPAGSICSGQSKTPVGRTYRTVKKPKRGGGTEEVTQAVNTGTDIYHASATKLNPDGLLRQMSTLSKMVLGRRLPLRMMVERHIHLMMT